MKFKTYQKECYCPTIALCYGINRLEVKDETFIATTLELINTFIYIGEDIIYSKMDLVFIIIIILLHPWLLIYNFVT